MSFSSHQIRFQAEGSAGMPVGPPGLFVHADVGVGVVVWPSRYASGDVVSSYTDKGIAISIGGGARYPLQDSFFVGGGLGTDMHWLFSSGSTHGVHNLDVDAEVGTTF